MLRHCTACFAFACLTTALIAAEPAAPASPPPQVGAAQLVGEVLVLERAIQQAVPETKVREEMVAGKLQQVTYTAYRWLVTAEQAAYGTADYRIVNLAGQPVDPATAAERLASATLVLVSSSGKKVDPQHLEVYKPDTLLIYLRPQPPPPAPAAPPPAPVRAMPVPPSPG